MQIINYLKKVSILSSLTSQELEYLESISKKEKYPKNTVLIIEGSLADSLYILLSGVVEVYTNNRLGSDVVLKRLSQGSFFGEQGYRNKLIRTANVRTINEVKVLKINYSALDIVFKKKKNLQIFDTKSGVENLFVAQGKSSDVTSYIKEIFASDLDETNQKRIAKVKSKSSTGNIITSSVRSFFQGISALYSKFKLRKHAEIKTFKKGDIIFSKGDASEFVCFVLSGSVELCFEDIVKNIILKKGNIFGDHDALKHETRHHTAKALTNVKLMVIDGSKFIEVIKKYPKLKSLIVSLDNSYVIAKDKININQFTGKFQGEDAIFTIYNLKSKEKAIAIKLLKLPIFKFSLGGVIPDKVLEFKRGDLIRRSIAIKDGLIIAINVLGEWEEVNTLCGMLLNKVTVPKSSINLFEKYGNILLISSTSNYLKSDILCNCLSIHYKEIKEAVDNSCKTLKEVAERTGAGTICGGCSNKVLEVLNQSAWTYATIEINEKYTEDIYSFLIKPLNSGIVEYAAGQYIGLRLQIDSLWIERFYTITRSPKAHGGSYEIIIKKRDKGVFTPWLFENNNKTLFIYVSKPTGNFTVPQSSNNKPILCFAGGIGITPFIAFIRDIMHSHSKAKLSIIYSVTDKALSVIPVDVADFLKTSRNVTLKLWVSAKNGQLKEEFIASTINLVQPQSVYICGPIGFEDTITKSLNELKFPKDNIFIERFFPKY